MIERACDVCGADLAEPTKTLRAEIKGQDGMHLAHVTLNILTRTGAEDVCLHCAVAALASRLTPERVDMKGVA